MRFQKLDNDKNQHMQNQIIEEKTETKRIIKRRLNNLNKQYLVLNNNLYEWKNESKDLKPEMRAYDQTMKNVLPYFPVVFEKKNSNVKMTLESKRLKIFYNEIEVNQEMIFTKEARLQIIQQLEKTFRPHKQFVYTNEKDKEGIKQMLKQESY